MWGSLGFGPSFVCQVLDLPVGHHRQPPLSHHPAGARAKPMRVLPAPPPVQSAPAVGFWISRGRAFASTCGYEPVPESVFGDACHCGEIGGGKPAAPILGDGFRPRLRRVTHKTECVPFQNCELVVHILGHPLLPTRPIPSSFPWSLL